MSLTRWLDERGRRCPLPVVALMRAVNSSQPGQRINLISDDPAAAYDVPAWCRMKGVDLLGEDAPPDGGAGRVFMVRAPG